MSGRTEALGWRGEILADVRILGVTVDAVMAVDRRAHHARRSTGQGPVLDYDTLKMWEWPEWDAPRVPEVIRLVGCLSRGRSWRKALSGAARLRGFASSAIAVPEAPQECRLEAQLRGVGVLVTAGGAGQVVEPAASDRAPGTKRRVLDRWVEECLYGAWLEQVKA